MESIKILKKEPIRIPFSVTIPDDYNVLIISLLDRKSDDIILHIDFRHMENKIFFNNRIGHVWGDERPMDWDFGAGFLTGEILIEAERFVVRINDVNTVIEKDRSMDGRELRVYSDFRFITLGSSASKDQAYSRRWPFFHQETKAPVLGSKLRKLRDMTSRPVGLSGLFLWNDNHENAADFLRKISTHLDEIVIVVHDATSVDISAILHLQSLYYNLKYVVSDKVYYNNHKPKKLGGAAFVNAAIAETKFKNIILLSDLSTKADSVAGIIRDSRLRSRNDAFLLSSAVAGRGVSDILSFSVEKDTYFEDAPDGPVIAVDDLAARHLIVTDRIDQLAGRDWSIDVTDMLSADGEPKVHIRVLAPAKREHFVVPRRKKLVFLIISCRKNRDKQEAIRQTWLKDLPIGNFEYCFVEGDPGAEAAHMAGDRLLVPAPDTYEYLSHKIWHAFKAAAERFDAAYFFKIDDDCVCNVEKFMEFEYEAFDYVGSDIVAGENTIMDWHYSSVSNGQLSSVKFGIDYDQNWFDGQGGYIVSRNAINKITETNVLDFQHMLEDYAVGSCLKAHGIMADMTPSDFQSIRLQYIYGDLDYGRAVVTDISSIDMYESVYRKFCSLNGEQRNRNSGWRLDVKSE